MPKYRSGIQLTPVRAGEDMIIHVHGDAVSMHAPADGIHFAIPNACHFFIPERLLYEKLDDLHEQPKKKKS